MILRKEIKSGYTTIPKNITRDDRLYLKDMGLLLKLLSLPDNWVFTLAGLEQIIKKDKKDSIRTGLANLEKYGYLRRDKVRNEKGQLVSTNWFITDVPFSCNPISENPISGNPISGNPTQLNTNSTYTEETKTEGTYCVCPSGHPIYPPESGQYKAAKFLSEQIHFNIPDLKKASESDIQKWCGTFNAIYKDKTNDWEIIFDVIEWATTNDFWKDKITSATYFSRKYPQLLAQMRSDYDKRNT